MDNQKKKYIGPNDEQYIIENYSIMTVSELSKKTKISYSHIYNYMIRKGLVIVSERVKKKKVAPKKKTKSIFFDPHERENWLI